MDNPLTRRRTLLQTAGAGSVGLLAGCSGILPSDDEPDDDTPVDDTDDTGEEGVDDGDGDRREVGIIAEPDEEALAELEQDVQTGEITQEEAIEQQQEIIEQAIEDMSETLQTETGIEIDEEFPNFGAVRATGDPFELVDALTATRVSALVDTEALNIEQPTG